MNFDRHLKQVSVRICVQDISTSENTKFLKTKYKYIYEYQLQE